MPIHPPSEEELKREAQRVERQAQRQFEREMRQIDRERAFREKIYAHHREAERRRNRRINAIRNEYCYNRSRGLCSFKNSHYLNPTELLAYAIEEERKQSQKKADEHRAENEAREAECLKREEERGREREERERQRMNERWRRMGSSLRIY